MDNAIMRRFLIALVVLNLTALHGQAPALTDLLGNTIKLKATLTVDRSTYFGGEAVKSTVTVANPIGAPLQTLAPFSSATGCLDLYTALTDLPVASELLCRMDASSALPTTSFGPGEQRARIVGPFDATVFGGAMPPFFGFGVPLIAGPYRLIYSYPGGATATFQVVLPHVDAAGSLETQPATSVDPVTGQTSQIPQYMHVVALRWNNQTFICMSRTAVTWGEPIAGDENGNLFETRGPFERIAISPNPVISVGLALDSTGSLIVTWTDSLGQTRSIPASAAALPGDVDPLKLFVSPPNVSLQPLQVQQFSTIVANSTSTGTNWSVALDLGAPTGAPLGTISASGLYTAPTSIALPYTVIVTGQSQSDPAKKATATISLVPPPVVAAPTFGRVAGT